MVDIILHPQTAARLEAFTARPPHALLVAGPAGIGKGAVARLIAAEFLNISDNNFEAHPYFKLIAAEDGGRTIGIEAIRELEHFTSLKVPNSSVPVSISRIALIENAHLLTREAQNALLKTLEEPPAGTLIILSSISAQTMLPTIRSRVSIIDIKQPATDQLLAHFSKLGHDSVALNKAIMMSGGLPGLTQAILNGDSTHPLVQATEIARKILQSTTFERLCLVDQLSRQRQESLDVVFILQQMARAAFSADTGMDKASGHRWNRVLRAAHETERQLAMSAQPKLVLTSLMLEL